MKNSEQDEYPVLTTAIRLPGTFKSRNIIGDIPPIRAIRESVVFGVTTALLRLMPPDASLSLLLYPGTFSPRAVRHT